MFTKAKLINIARLITIIASASATSSYSADYCNSKQNFINLGNGTVYDISTKLQWSICYLGEKFDAERGCTGKAFEGDLPALNKAIANHRELGASDWRIPNWQDYTTLGMREVYFHGLRYHTRDIKTGELPREKTSCSGLDFSANILHGTSGGYKEIATGKPQWYEYDGVVGVELGDTRSDQKYVFYVPNEKGRVRPVRQSASWGTNQEQHSEVVAKLLKIGPISVSWKPSGTAIGRINVASIPRQQDLIYALLAARLIADKLRAYESLPAVVNDSPPQLSVPSIQKGEFETTADFSLRQTALEKKSRDEHAKQLAQYEQEKINATRIRAQAEAAFNDAWREPDGLRARASEMLAKIVTTLYGDPQLRNVIYDADRQIFNASVIGNTSNNQSSSFYAPASFSATIETARKLKEELASGKIAPNITITFPEGNVDFSLEEDSARRTRLFASVLNNSSTAPFKKIKELTSLISEYPDSTEARQAGSEIPRLQLRAYQDAERVNRTSDWQSFINDFSGNDTQKLIPRANEKKIAAQKREAEEERLARIQWERDRPAREAREMVDRARALCQAQVNTCIASCPRDRVLTTLPDSQCKWRCESVSCN